MLSKKEIIFSAKEYYKYLEEICCLQLFSSGMKIQAAGYTETLADFYETTWRRNLADKTIHTHHSKNLNLPTKYFS